MPELEIVGNDFFESNRKIKKVNMPKLSKVIDYNGHIEKLEVASLKNSKLKKMLLKNKNVSKTIAPSDIAVLDKKSEITTLEVESAKGIIQKIVDYAKKVYKKLTKKEDVDR